MESSILEILTNAGPIGLVALLMFYFLQRKEKHVEKLAKQSDEKTDKLINKFIDSEKSCLERYEELNNKFDFARNEFDRYKEKDRKVMLDSVHKLTKSVENLVKKMEA